MTHIVWDWNGTLFDDMDAVVTATNETFESYGLGPFSLADFRAAYTRPIWVGYERLLGRPLRPGEWRRLDVAFHDSYHRLMAGCALAVDARPAIDAVGDAGHTQSLLSMWRHDRLVSTLQRIGLTSAFRRVDGLRPEQAGGPKTEFLIAHLAALGLAPDEVIMVGDSADDARAAAHVGARIVLYSGGVQARADLETFGVPVVERLSDVVAHI